MAWIPAAIGAGAALLGGFLGNQQDSSNTSALNAANTRNTAATNKANKEIAQEQIAFQERMSNSAYQRAMEDMRQAKLNPMLAYSQGGASAPSGAAIAMQNPQLSKPNYQDPIAPAIASGVGAYNQLQTLNNAGAQLGINQADSTAGIALKAAQTQATVNSATKAATETEILRSRAKREHLEGNFYGSDMGKTFFNLQKINEATGGTLDSLNSAKDLINPFKGLKNLKPQKLQQKLNKKTGEIEIWTP